ncbi:MAG: iron-sulfur cluster assembly scaffold protein [Desulfitobacteriaceae bacterium]|nr:iron-sulfur cluster assembly scaffold protein [Desulfitobacteriaceae bacterium]MDD4751911.1 iron-sulfur cluster assembly scaffold protein [Desulfitobacteriaceae bacterium]
MWYNMKVMELFLDPENVGVIENSNGIGEGGDPHCGDHLKLYIKVEDNIIKDISFQVIGCCAAIASSSMTTILAKGKTLDEALKIKENDIVDALGGLPEEKIHCSVMGAAALKNAILNYYENNSDA